MGMSYRITGVTAVLTVLLGIALHPSGAQEARATASDSAEGLEAQIDTILQAAKSHSKKNADSKAFDDLISDLRIPENSNWFASTFGDDLGAKLAAKYKQSWDGFQDALTRSLRGDAEAKPKQTLVTSFGSTPGFAMANMTSLEASAKTPVALYEVLVLTERRGKDAVPGIYVYADGAFRVLNWATLYELPNVRPGRIRIGGNVAQAKLVHRVNPRPPPEAFQKHVQGTVQLHVVIDVEGNVKQVDVIGGPAEVQAAAVDAVKQWRYQPTLLNGDPVEVDTTVLINFMLGS